MRLLKTCKDAALITLFVLSVLFLFTLQGILQQVDYSEEEPAVTGEVIRVGRPEPEPKEPPPGVPPPKRQEPPVTNKNLQCWLDAGVRKDDLKIVGNLLRTTPCKLAREKRQLEVRVEGECLLFDVETKAITGVCVDTPTPNFKIDLPSGGTGEVTVPPVKRNYALALLLLVALFLTFGLWSWDEMRSTFRKGDDHKEYDELELQYGKRRAPKYEEGTTKEVAITKEVDKIYRSLVKEKRPAKRQLNQKQLISIIAIFNRLSDKLYEAIKKNRVIRAERTYKKLLRTYPALFHSVNQENRKVILKVIVYFGKQVRLLQKSKKISHLIKKAYADVTSHKVDVKKPMQESVTPPIPKELDKSLRALKRVLEKAKDTKDLKSYKKLFTTIK